MKISKLLNTVLAVCLLAGCAEKETQVEVSSVSLNTSTIEMVEGETFNLTATVLPNDAVYDKVIWASSNASVASVNQGTVTALKQGTSTITASAGGKSATCTVKVATKVIAVTSVTLDKTSLSMKIGDTETLTATVNPADATDKTITWMSSDVSVVTVSDGKLIAKDSGTATITAKAGNCTADCTVTVSVDVESISLDITTLSLIVGESATLTATVKPDNATDKNVVWASSDNSVATVSNGKVTAVKAGTTTIKATCGGKTAECAVTVTVPTGSITLDKTVLSLAVGESATLTATVKPDNATDKNVVWASSDNTVATVSNGKVTAVKAGTATVKATCGGKTAECVVTVTVPVSSVTLDKTVLSLAEGESATLTATVKPANATDKNVVWASSDNTVATVSNGKVTAVKAGTATVKATCGGKTAECVVTVTVPVSSVTLDKTVLSLAEGESATLTATVKPDNATDKNVVWTSSDNTVATVSNGKVTAVNVGTATVKATCGGKTAECVVTVTVPVSSVTLDKTVLSLAEGESATLTATVKPANATDKNVVWTSSDNSVATVSNGKVNAVKAGTATVNATCGGKTAECVVTVMATPLISYTTVNGKCVEWKGSDHVIGYNNLAEKVGYTQEYNNNNGMWEIYFDSEVKEIRIWSESANLETIKVNKSVKISELVFNPALNLNAIDCSICDVCPTSLGFHQTKITSLEASSWNVSRCDKIYLDSNYYLNHIDVSHWDTSNITDMFFMFGQCSSLTSLDPSSWDTSNVCDMSRMFEGCKSLLSLDLSKWNTTLLSDVGGMFDNCSKISSINLSNWDTTNISDYSYMFAYCDSLETVDLSGWKVNASAKIKDLFASCYSLKNIYMRGCDAETISIINSVKPTNAVIITE